MEDLTLLKTDLDKVYKAAVNRAVDFHYVLLISEYVSIVQCSKVLSRLIENEHQDLRATRYRIPKAVNKRQGKILERVIEETLFLNCSEDFERMTWYLEALQHLRAKTPADEMSDPEIRMEYDLWELERGHPGKKNYYIDDSQKSKWSLQKVHKYLIGELWKLEKEAEAKKGFTEKGSTFDEKTGVLYINGLPVEIKGQNTITDQYRIMKYIFSSPNIGDDFFYTEIANGIFDNSFKLSRYTTACEKIQKKIADKIDIKDYLSFNYSKKQGKVSINPKYLA